MIAKDYLRIERTSQVNHEVEKDCDSQGILMHDVTWLALRITGVEMHRENIKEESIHVCWIDASTAF